MRTLEQASQNYTKKWLAIAYHLYPWYSVLGEYDTKKEAKKKAWWREVNYSYFVELNPNYKK
jgi:hypothetical protein